MLFAELLEQHQYYYCLHDATNIAKAHNKPDYLERFNNVYNNAPTSHLYPTEQQQDELERQMSTQRHFRRGSEETEHKWEHFRYRVLSIKTTTSPYRQSQALLELVKDDYAQTAHGAIFLLSKLARLYYQHSNIRSQLYRNLTQIEALVNTIITNLDEIPFELYVPVATILYQLHLKPTVSFMRAAWVTLMPKLNNEGWLSNEKSIFLLQLVSHASFSETQRKLVLSIFKTINLEQLSLPLTIKACYHLAILDNLAKKNSKETLLHDINLRRAIQTLLGRLLNNEKLSAIVGKQRFKCHHFAFVASQYFIDADGKLKAEFEQTFSETIFAKDTAPSQGNPSRLQNDVADILAHYRTGSGLQQEQIVAGYTIDFQWLTDEKVIIVEVDGPSHFLMGETYNDCVHTPKDQLREHIIKHVQREKFPLRDVVIVRIPYHRWPSNENLAAKKRCLEKIFSEAGHLLTQIPVSEQWQTVGRGGKHTPTQSATTPRPQPIPRIQRSLT